LRPFTVSTASFVNYLLFHYFCKITTPNPPLAKEGKKGVEHIMAKILLLDIPIAFGL